MKHAWIPGQVKNFNSKRRNRSKIPASRSGQVCINCRLVSIPPSKGAAEWVPPAGDCNEPR
jgi:hypothetical protein